MWNAKSGMSFATHTHTHTAKVVLRGEHDNDYLREKKKHELMKMTFSVRHRNSKTHIR